MQRRHFILGGAAGAAAETFAQDFVPLFDGRSLQGWHVEKGHESAFYVKDGAIVIHEGGGFPAWLRTEREYENFEWRGEMFIQGWANSGLYLHAPRYGRPTQCGLKINIFQKLDDPPLAESMGAIFPVMAPRKVNVRNKGEWNEFRVRVNWPELKVWINGELVQDLDCGQIPELRHRLRRGYLGIESLSYPVRFRGLAIRELPATERWQVLYATQEDLTANWQTEAKEILEKSRWETLGGVLRGENLGYLATKESYRDFALQMYVRASRHSNGGIYFRCPQAQKGEHYEIQIHDVEGAVYPTGSLYGIKRAQYPVMEPEQWFLFQMHLKDDHCLVRVNGDTVMETRGLKNLASGPVMLQAHQQGKWIEYQEIKIRRL
jgi:hypothetical protein